MLTRSEVKAENLLFATLDTATRRLRFPRDREVVITDTVGFIKDLPKDLLGAFRATLDEMQDADLILHVVDISNPRFEQQMESVDNLLNEIGLDEIPKLVVFNKVDLVNPLWAKVIASRFHGVRLFGSGSGNLRRSAERDRKEGVGRGHEEPRRCARGFGIQIRDCGKKGCEAVYFPPMESSLIRSEGLPIRPENRRSQPTTSTFLMRSRIFPAMVTSRTG